MKKIIVEILCRWVFRLEPERFIDKELIRVKEELANLKMAIVENNTYELDKVVALYHFHKAQERALWFGDSSYTPKKIN